MIHKSGKGYRRETLSPIEVNHLAHSIYSNRLG